MSRTLLPAKTRWGRDGRPGGRMTRTSCPASLRNGWALPRRRRPKGGPQGRARWATQEPYGHRQQSATEWRPAGPCSLRRRKLRASTAERDRKAVRRAVLVGRRRSLTGIDSRARPNGGPQGRARCDGGSYEHRQQSATEWRPAQGTERGSVRQRSPCFAVIRAVPYQDGHAACAACRSPGVRASPPANRTRACCPRWSP